LTRLYEYIILSIVDISAALKRRATLLTPADALLRRRAFSPSEEHYTRLLLKRRKASFIAQRGSRRH